MKDYGDLGGCWPTPKVELDDNLMSITVFIISSETFLISFVHNICQFGSFRTKLSFFCSYSSKIKLRILAVQVASVYCYYLFQLALSI